jgi:Spy/CpxP family protein refolding chaperone
MLSDARFERRELDAQTLRRLRSALTPEQARQVPQLQPRVRRPGTRGEGDGRDRPRAQPPA